MNAYYRRTLGWAIVIALLLSGGPAMAQVFVVPGGAGSQNGTSWANAYGEIQAALNDGRAAAEDVWVAAGTYTEFEIIWPANVSGYGGFVGNETSLAQRNVSAVAPTPNETIIDGNMQGRVIIVANSATNTRIDGFTITGGDNQEGGFDGFAGSALRYNGSNNTNTLVNCWIFNNHQGDNNNHGTVWLQNSSPNIINCVVENNSSKGIAGGMLVNDGSMPIVTNTTFKDNFTQNNWNAAVTMRDGGAHGTFINCLFEDNVGGSGGAVSFRDGGESHGTLIGCTFRNNSSAGPGGAIRVPAAGEGTVTIQDCVFEDNTGGHGGAIALWDTAKIVTIERTMFIGNATIANNHGAAIAVHARGTANITNCAFIENHGGGISSAIFAWHQPGEVPTTYNVHYSSFYGNTGGAGFTVRADGVSGSLHNSIVWGNEANGVNVPVTNSIVQGGTWNEDPMFVDADAGDLRLLASSPAINEGLAPFPATDLLGVARPKGSAPDVGAYEFEPLSVSISGPSAATIGQNVNLILNHNAIGEPTIVWRKNGNVIDGEIFTTLPLGEMKSLDESGVYSVTVTAENGEASASFTLIVVEGLPVSSPLALVIVALLIALSGMVLVSRRRVA